ncbi:unnamed protein product [Adineta ricciae]|uniref:Uncharacterized protein n=1 Tax=Adineta ricciae TaxID=249248 RepID=A0A814HZP6_ADIRI|nr:unnamed protein product [Adineta ricciae]
MRRHSLDTNSIRQQIKSIFTSPSRKIRNLTNQHHHEQHHESLRHPHRHSRRFSVPDKKSSEKIDLNNDLGTINEKKREKREQGGSTTLLNKDHQDGVSTYMHIYVKSNR